MLDVRGWRRVIAPHPLTIYYFQAPLGPRLVLFRGIESRGIELAKQANDRDVVPNRGAGTTNILEPTKS
jgi:hypothetical protein